MWGCCSRENNWAEIAHECKQQQHSGNHAMHVEPQTTIVEAYQLGDAESNRARGRHCF
jgi:hypothetical protein